MGIKRRKPREATSICFLTVEVTRCLKLLPSDMPRGSDSFVH